MRGFNFGDFGNILKQAKDMKAKMQQMKEEAAKLIVESSSGGGMVKVKVRGDQTLLSVEIEDAVIDVNEKDMLQDLILAAVNDAFRKVNEQTKEQFQQLTGGLNIPDIF